MTQAPRISLLLPVYNSAAYLETALQSLLTQTFTDFEIIAINDASTDASAAILAACTDSRLRVLHNSQNLGVAQSLNRGLQESRAPYIARMDADDIAHPDRLRQQVDYLDRHPEVVLLGTAFYVFATGSRRPYALASLETDDALIRWYCCWYNRFAHPSVMFRRSAVMTLPQPGYDPAVRVAQDYDLWTRLLATGQGANLAHPLLSYRVHAVSHSVREAGHLVKEHMKTAHRFTASTLGLALDPAVHQAITGFFVPGPFTDAEPFPLDLYRDLARHYTATLPQSIAARTYRRIHADLVWRLLRQGRLRSSIHPDLLHILPQKCLQQLRFYLSRPPILPDEKQPS